MIKQFILAYLFLVLLYNTSHAQEVKRDTIQYSKHSATAGIGMETLYYLQYKYKFYNSRFLQSNVLVGIGDSPRDEEGDLPAHYTISTGYRKNKPPFP
ncbi:hypothetical protein C7H79_16970 [Nitrosomonas supralitoralis]|uniref:Uncharacterized protein n=1 Tax=Nitrosomonas supralitoralis TaxID=2116706 RepID=A0A2P7NQS5_9PROT|nr:hypothetical protein C7H79_16970 [Nitrosomonas supralitoralis]